VDSGGEHCLRLIEVNVLPLVRDTKAFYLISIVIGVIVLAGSMVAGYGTEQGKRSAERIARRREPYGGKPQKGSHRGMDTELEEGIGVGEEADVEEVELHLLKNRIKRMKKETMKRGTMNKGTKK